jgi:hypothetical protein
MMHLTDFSLRNGPLGRRYGRRGRPAAWRVVRLARRWKHVRPMFPRHALFRR